MDVQHLSEADLHLVFGLLLKKKRTPSQERKVLSILRSEMDLPAKLEAIVKVSRVQVLEIGGAQANFPGCSLPSLSVDAITHIRSDTLWTYEVGAKTQLPAVLISAAAYDIEWKDVQ